MKYGIDADKYIRSHGGVSETARFLTSREFPVTRAGVCKWGKLQMIPMRAWLTINAIEPDLDLRNFILETK